MGSRDGVKRKWKGSVGEGGMEERGALGRSLLLHTWNKLAARSKYVV
jgi:hypothetical protein